MSVKKEIGDLELGDLVILPNDPDREYRPVVATESDQVFGEKVPVYYITVRGLLDAYCGAETETVPFKELED